MAKVKTSEEIREENVKTTAAAAENFFVQNRKLLIVLLAVIIVLGLGVLGYHKFVYAPAVAQAEENSYVAEINFQKGEFELALEGDGVNLGFAQICDKYGAKAGKAVYLYAGTCCAQLGRWEEALSYLKKYNGKEPILAARALALEGDCYVALGDMAKAVNFYDKASSKADNMFAAEYLLKAGRAYASLGQNDRALAAFRAIKDKYPMSYEASSVDKYINEIAE